MGKTKAYPSKAEGFFYKDMEQRKQKVIVYVDGFNFYYGLKSKADVYQKRCDITMLVSADSDLVPPIERIKELDPTHKIIVCFPPNRHSFNLKKWSNGVKTLTDWKLYDECLLPETVILPDGFILKRPSKWTG